MNVVAVVDEREWQVRDEETIITVVCKVEVLGKEREGKEFNILRYAAWPSLRERTARERLIVRHELMKTSTTTSRLTRYGVRSPSCTSSCEWQQVDLGYLCCPRRKAVQASKCR